MKNNLCFLLFLLLGCTPNGSIATKTSCPSVFFAAEHGKYITGNAQPVTLENISYSANINNYAFKNNCLITNNILQTDLSLLFIVKPDQAKVSSITLPFYVAILSNNDELIDLQYYQTQGNFKSDSLTKKYIETEIIETITLQIPFQELQENSENTLVVGFMLNKEKIMILN